MNKSVFVTINNTGLSISSVLLGHFDPGFIWLFAVPGILLFSWFNLQLVTDLK